ncbi:MAG TPA: hypothetical protein VGM97_10110 [Steroidobacteraceae bacterium]|jgi:hypothetical protein
MKFPRLHYCHDCARDCSARTLLRKGLLTGALVLGCLAVFAQSPPENTLRITELERRVAPIEDLTVRVAKIETELHDLGDKVDAQITQGREIEGAILLLFVTKLLDAFGVTVRRK